VVGTTVFSGAFVAGNDAGRAYNDWPLYAGRLVPEEVWEPALGLRNLFENTATVQFDHRNLAYASIASVAALNLAAARADGAGSVLPPRVRFAVRLLGGLVGAQATLGVVTLVLYVPIELGAAHQAGALALWTGALYAAHAVARAAGPRGAAAAAAAAAAGAR
jgi:cytochrome c oxidase assembly protein subunit 15